MTEQHNRFAGQGPVVLDIGGDVGALIVFMPPAMEGEEVEIRPVGYQPSGNPDHTHDHPHGHDHDHGGHGHLPHVAVVPRPIGESLVHSLVYPGLVEGRYELYVRPAGPVQLTAEIVGGQVTELSWPG